jgi:hypothetical protein
MNANNVKQLVQSNVREIIAAYGIAEAACLCGLDFWLVRTDTEIARDSRCGIILADYDAWISEIINPINQEA